MQQGRSAASMMMIDLVVLAAGLATTVMSLIGVYLLAFFAEDFEIMGWYAVFVIPVGAILVGCLSGSGYGIASWFTGRKVSGRLLLVVLLLLVLAYGAAQWLEFVSLQLVDESGQQVSFAEYYDYVTRNMTFSSSRSDSPGSPLGVVGYLFRLLELVGFAGGGLIIPGVLMFKPYCDDCSTYMRTRALGQVPASVKLRKVKKSDHQGQAMLEQEMQEALEHAMEVAKTVTEAVTAGDAAATRSLMEQHGVPKRQVNKLPLHVGVALSACPRCHVGFVTCSLEGGAENQIKAEEISKVDVTESFTRSMA